MQWLSAQPLVDKFRNGTFEEAEVEPYFMAYMIFDAVVMAFALGDSNPMHVVTGLASVVITIFGVLHLKKQNGETFGRLFVVKYFCLGWVVSVRMLLLAIPAAVVLYAFAAIIGGRSALGPMGVLFTIGWEILFYWWLGKLIAQSNNSGDGDAGAVV